MSDQPEASVSVAEAAVESAEDAKRGKALVFANDLAALLNQAKADGLLVSLNTNEYDAHTVRYGTGPGIGRWLTVRRDGEDGNGPYEVFQ